MGLLPWLVLIAAAVGIRANRDYRTLLLLIPLATANLLYLFILFCMSLWTGSSMDSSGKAQFDLLFYPLAIGVTLLWLAAPALARLPAAVRIAGAVASMIVVAGLTIVSFGTPSPGEIKMFLVFLSLFGAALALTPAAAARLCGQSYRPVAFTLWLGAWLIVGGVLATLSFLVVLVSMNEGPNASELSRLAVQGIAVGAILGVFLYVLYLPYLFLAFNSAFFRARLQACLNLHRVDESVYPPSEQPGRQGQADRAD
jgi:hypothetical protein